MPEGLFSSSAEKLECTRKYKTCFLRFTAEISVLRCLDRIEADNLKDSHGEQMKHMSEQSLLSQIVVLGALLGASRINHRPRGFLDGIWRVHYGFDSESRLYKSLCIYT